MRISHKHKFVFIAVPKTASYTIRSCLNEYSDVKSRGSRRTEFLEEGRYYWHITSSELKKHFNEKKITSAINKVLSKKFKKSLLKVVNPYEKKNSSDRIITILRRTNFRKLQSKNFFDYKII